MPSSTVTSFPTNVSEAAALPVAGLLLLASLTLLPLQRGGAPG
jgi:hypothetical protein